MKRFAHMFDDWSPKDYNNLLTIFLASVFGSLGTTAFMTWITTDGQAMAWPERLLLSLGATIIYGAIVLLTFYIFSPQSRPALKRLLTRQD
ncbi:MAG TPA: hypothetical protein VK879_12110 [Candidatus Sulfomarinibacteraceae bacterium]|nr:hypothetical protein [Candidatus Sulfomarinibacteraceae bacterium]